jgi:hypothetical protein
MANARPVASLTVAACEIRGITIAAPPLPMKALRVNGVLISLVYERACPAAPLYRSREDYAL